jgi:hypothetical protein
MQRNIRGWNVVLKFDHGKVERQGDPVQPEIVEVE